MIKELLREYELKRDLKEYEAEQRREAIYEQVPQLLEIEEAMKMAGIKYARSCFANKDKVEEITRQYKEYVESLKEKKNQICASYKIHKSYLEVDYDCKECNDTGFVGEVVNKRRCKCLEQKLISASYKNSNMENTLAECNFDNFNFDRFSTEVLQHENESARNRIKDIYDTSISFIEKFDEKNANSLLFIGGTGVGKTYMSSCIAKELLDDSKIVIYQKSSKISETLEAYRFSREPSGDVLERYNRLYNCDFLIIDDLGAEKMNEYILSEFFTLLDTRIMNKKKCLISSNLNLAQLKEYYGERVFSRIAGNYKVLKFIGKDLRWEA